MRRLSLIGVDVSDSSIKVLQLDDECKIVAYGNGALDEGVVSDGLVLNKEVFGKTLTHILDTTQPKVLSSEESLLRAIVCLPESKLFTHYVVLPPTLKSTDIDTYVQEDAQKIIPFNLDELYWDYHVVEKDGQRHVSFVGAPKVNVDSYVEAFNHARIKPALIGGELFSLGSALLPSDLLTEDYIIIDIGAHTTSIGIFSVDAIANMSVTIPVGGKQLTDAIAKELELSPEKAEQMKRDKGVDEKYEDTEVPKIIKECLTELVNTVEQARSYFETKTGRHIQHVVIAGGTSLLPALPEYFTSIFGIETHLANPLQKIQNKEVLGKDTSEIFFANVAGLALSGQNLANVGINLLTQYRYSDDATHKEKLALADIRSMSDFKYVAYAYFDTVRDFGMRAMRLVGGKMKQWKVNTKLVFSVLFTIVAVGFFIWVIISYT